MDRNHYYHDWLYYAEQLPPFSSTSLQQIGLKPNKWVKTEQVG